MASRPGKLRIESAVPLAKRALKNIRAAFRAAVVRALWRAPVVTAFGRVVCGLRPR